MITFGLTGGIASGKSTVTKSLRANNVPVVDADIVARQVVEPGTPGLAQVIQYFGPQFLLPDGSLDRIKLGNLIFADKTLRDVLNHVMLPLINDESALQLKKFHDEGHEIVGYDGALICEMGNADKYRPLIVVSCTQEQQIERLMKRNSLTLEAAMHRINAQMSVAEKIAMADIVIDTSGTIEESIKQTETTYLCLRIALRDQRMTKEGKR